MRSSSARALLITLALLSTGAWRFAAARPLQGTAPGAAPAPVERLRTRLNAATTSPGVRQAVWGVVAVSLDTGERLFDLNPRTLLVPASVAKLVSTAGAIESVGWDYRFETLVRMTGGVREGVLHGDVLVIGAGDPSIGGRGGRDLDTWVQAFRDAGIRAIDGRIIGIDDAFEEPRPGFAWSWDDLGYTTGALFGALNLAENSVVVSVAPGSAPGAPAVLLLADDAMDVPLTNRVGTTDPGGHQLVWPEMRPGETALTIAGTVPVNARPARLRVAVGNPTTWFVRALKRALATGGIAVSGDAVDADDLPPGGRAAIDGGAATTLFAHRSPTLAELLRPTFKMSVNLYGEAIQRLNSRDAAPRTNDGAVDALTDRLTAWQIAPGSVQLVDGSGLSRRDVASADAIVAVLEHMSRHDDATPWYEALPVAAVDGTLEGRFAGTAAAGNLRAKTGTMSNIRSLAGYVRSRDGEALAFAAIVNNFEGTGGQAIAAIDAIGVALAEFTRRP